MASDQSKPTGPKSTSKTRLARTIDLSNASSGRGRRGGAGERGAQHMPADRSNSNSTATLAYGASAAEREKSLDLTVSQIERRFGKGAIRKLGEHRAHARVDATPPAPTPRE